MKIIERISNIQRPLDPRDPTNVGIAVLSLIVTVTMSIVTLASQVGVISAAREGLRAGITFFLGWAIAREFDPDQPYSAFTASIAILLAHLLGFSANLLLLGWALLTLRYLNRSTGKPATITDLLAGVLLTGWLVWTADWFIGILTAFAYALDGYLSSEKKTRFALAAISIFIAGAGWRWGSSTASFEGINTHTFAFLVLITLMAIPFLVGSERVRSRADLTDQPLLSTRVRAAQGFYLATIILSGMKMGIRESGTVISIASVIVGTAIYFVASKLVALVGKKLPTR